MRHAEATVGIEYREGVTIWDGSTDTKQEREREQLPKSSSVVMVMVVHESNQMTGSIQAVSSMPPKPSLQRSTVGPIMPGCQCSQC